MSDNVHVCLISDHLLPNIIPVLMDKPEKVYAITTEKMKQQGKLFKKFLKQRGIHVHICENFPEALLSEMVPLAREQAKVIFGNHPASKIVLNVTGGTKLMAMAFSIGFEGGENRKIETIYTHTDHNVIEYLDNREEQRPIDSVLDVRGYLEARGFNVKSCASENPTWSNKVNGREGLTRHLANTMPTVEEFVKRVNTAVQGVPGQRGALNKMGELVAPVQTVIADANGEDLLDMFSDNGLIQRLSNDQVKFLSADAASYLSGGWIEEYVWHVLQPLDLYDIKCDVKGRWAAGVQHAPENQFDCIAVHRNRMLFIECKTVSFGRGGTKGQPIINTIDALGNRAKGLFSTTLLFSALPLDDATRDRAATYKIQVLEGSQITTLPEFVRKWMGNQPATN